MSSSLQVSQWIVAELIRHGITYFIISPGSRSTPLTVAAARNRQAETIVHFDERGAAYFALGYAKARGRAAALICTSGTAVANYFPAVIEASMDNIPLIVLSADRPPELIGVGANQAIFQEQIYGAYPRFFKNLPPPDAATTFQQISTSITQLCDAVSGTRPGPVHLNCQFREPLLADPANTAEDYNPPPEQRQPRQQRVSKSAPQLSSRELHLISHRLTETATGILVVGRSLSPANDELILELAANLGWPIFPDIQSRLRFREHPNIINHFDLALLQPTVQEYYPQVVLHLGGAFTSKRLLNFLDHPQIHYISVKPSPETVDPNHQVAQFFQTPIQSFCTEVSAQLRLDREDSTPRSTSPQNSTQHFLEVWTVVETKVRRALQSKFEVDQSLSEPGISYHLSRLLPPEHDLMLANSMAIRELELVGTVNIRSSHVFANRGASGIDGNLATAVGFQTGSGKGLTMVMGDLAALHDLNSLALLKDIRSTLVIVLINNHGGGIFNFLPVRTETDVFEPFFGTPHPWSFKAAAAMFRISYAAPENLSEFQIAYEQAVSRTGATLLELTTDRYQNHQFHTELFQVIRET